MKRQKENSKVSQREQGQDTDLITEVGETKGRGEMIKTQKLGAGIQASEDEVLAN